MNLEIGIENKYQYEVVTNWMQKKGYKWISGKQPIERPYINVEKCYKIILLENGELTIDTHLDVESVSFKAFSSISGVGYEQYKIELDDFTDAIIEPAHDWVGIWSKSSGLKCYLRFGDLDKIIEKYQIVNQP